MAGKYITAAASQPLKIDFKAYQVFHHHFATNVSHGESFTIRWFVDQSTERREWFNEVLIFLSKFQFATKAQLADFLAVHEIDQSHLDEYLEEMLARRLMNCFFLCGSPEKPDEGKNFPEDALIVYCMDLGAQHLLTHFYREDLVYWRTYDPVRSPEQVLKYLSTCQFYLALLRTKKDKLISFTSVYDAHIGRRQSRFSAIFEVEDVSGEHRKFILESVRDQDLPGYWDKKISEQMYPIVERGYWKQSFKTVPYFVLLTESFESATVAADILFRRMPQLKFCVTTDEEVQKGLSSATFFRYLANNPEDIAEGGALVPAKASVFTKYDSSED